MRLGPPSAIALTFGGSGFIGVDDLADHVVGDAAEVWAAHLAPATGLTDFGASLVRLEPGAWSSQRHWHEGEDEFVVMLERPSPAKTRALIAYTLAWFLLGVVAAGSGCSFVTAAA